MADISDDEFTSSLKCVSQRFNIERVRETQKETIVNFLKGKGVLVLQPTGSGKCLIFQSIQIRFLMSIGVKADYIWDEKNAECVKKGVETGLFQVVVGSPESFWGCRRWRRAMLTSTTL